MEFDSEQRQALLEALRQENKELRTQVEALRAFAQEVMECWPDGDVDGGHLQEIAEKHGLIELRRMTEFCGPACNCYGADVDKDKPWDCYHITRLLDPRIDN